MSQHDIRNGRCSKQPRSRARFRVCFQREPRVTLPPAPRCSSASASSESSSAASTPPSHRRCHCGSGWHRHFLCRRCLHWFVGLLFAAPPLGHLLGHLLPLQGTMLSRLLLVSPFSRGWRWGAVDYVRPLLCCAADFVRLQTADPTHSTAAQMPRDCGTNKLVFGLFGLLVRLNGTGYFLSKFVLLLGSQNYKLSHQPEINRAIIG